MLEELCRKPVVTVRSPPGKLILEQHQTVLGAVQCDSVGVCRTSEPLPDQIGARLFYGYFQKTFGCVFEQEDGKSTVSYLRFEHSRAINWSL